MPKDFTQRVQYWWPILFSFFMIILILFGLVDHLKLNSVSRYPMKGMDYKVILKERKPLWNGKGFNLDYFDASATSKNCTGCVTLNEKKSHIPAYFIPYIYNQKGNNSLQNHEIRLTYCGELQDFKLGNQIFMFASVYGVAKRIGFTPTFKIDPNRIDKASIVKVFDVHL